MTPVQRPSPGTDSPRIVSTMRLRKGMQVRELSKKVGQVPREGTVTAVRGSTVDVRWSDGHRSSMTGGYLVPAKRSAGSD